MISICALGHCSGRSASKEGSRSPKLCEQIKAGYVALCVESNINKSIINIDIKSKKYDKYVH